MPLPEAEEVHSGSSEDCLQPANCDCRSSSSSASLIVERKSQAKASDLLMPGKCGAKYQRFGAFSLMPRNYPSSAAIVSYIIFSSLMLSFVNFSLIWLLFALTAAVAPGDFATRSSLLPRPRLPVWRST